MYALNEIISQYFLHLKHPSDAQIYDVVEYVDEVARSSPDIAWPLIRALIEAAPNEGDLAYVAAGPLEILLMYHGNVAAQMIRADAMTNVQVQNALSHVLLPSVSVAMRDAIGEWLPDLESR